MANILERQIVLDGYRNVLIKLTGLIDTSDAVVAPALVLTDLVNNDKAMVFYALRVDEVSWSMKDGLLAFLEWNSTNPQQIAFLTGQGRICGEEFGGFIPDTLRPGFDGAINLRTQAFSPGTLANYTVVLEMTKMYR